MSETDRIWDQLQRSFEGNDAWRCPSLRDLLAAVSAPQAAARPIAGAPSVWELLLHTTVYEDVARRRLPARTVETLPDERGWPVPADTVARGVAPGEARLRRGPAGAAAGGRGLPGGAARGDRARPRVHLLRDAARRVEHALYHAGQIEMLMVAQGVRPSASPMAIHDFPP